MGLMAKRTNSDIPLIEAGTFQGVCYSVIDLGTQHNELFGKDTHKCIITWEIPSQRMEVGEGENKKDLPRVISKIYTLSIHEKSNLGKDLTSWRGTSFTQEDQEGFDVRNVAEANCLIQIIHEIKDNIVRARVANVSKLMREMPKLKPENPVVKFSMVDDGVEPPKDIPEWIEKMIKNSNEYCAVHEAVKNPALADAQQKYDVDPNIDEGIPF